ncbi:MAG: hypothetical protein WAW96_03380 [Alphaproteobacteria bacterium]
MKIINFFILLLAIPPAILSTIQLFNTSLPVVSPIYDSIVRTATDKVREVTRQGGESPQTSSASGAAKAPTPGPVAEEAAPAAADQTGEVSSLRPVHIGIAAVSIIIALLMFLGLRARARA